MKKSRKYILLQHIFRSLPQRVLSVFGALFPKPMYGVGSGYWMEFDIAEEIQRNIYLGRYEPIQTSWVKAILKEGGSFLDVGANVGYYTTLAARLVGNQGQVLAFEPSPYAYKKLESVIKYNDIVQVSAFQCAAGDKDEFRQLYLPNKNVHSPSLIPTDKLFTPVKVSVCRLDNHPALQSAQIIDLMKVDVEGFEPNVIQGYSKHLKSGQVKYLICEFNSGWLEPHGWSWNELLDSITNLGFLVIKTIPKVTLPGHNGIVYEHQDMLFKHRSLESHEYGSLAG